MGSIGIDRGHVGRTGGGAGAAFGTFREDILVREYMGHAEDALRAAGHEVLLLCHGKYSDRQKFAVDQALDVYIAAHVNAARPPGRYGLVCYDRRSKQGMALAHHIAEALQEEWGEALSTVKVEPSDASNWSHAWNLIKGVYAGRPVGVCFEPYFINEPTHQAMSSPEGLARTGRALATGVAAWLKERT